MPAVPAVYAEKAVQFFVVDGATLAALERVFVALGADAVAVGNGTTATRALEGL